MGRPIATATSLCGSCWPASSRLTGYDKLVDVEGAAGDIAEVGLPLPALLAVVAGLVELVCGAFLALGRRTEWAAAGLLLFLVPVTVLIENPSERKPTSEPSSTS